MSIDSLMDWSYLYLHEILSLFPTLYLASIYSITVYTYLILLVSSFIFLQPSIEIKKLKKVCGGEGGRLA